MGHCPSASRARIFAAAALLAVSAVVSHAGNILVNPGFEADGNHGVGAPITGWTFVPIDHAGQGGFWINVDQYAHSGANYYKVWGQYNGIPNTNTVYQEKPSLPSSTYTADAWIATWDAPGHTDYIWQSDTLDTAWAEVSFRDAGGNILALYQTAVFDGTYSVNTWYDMQVTNICQPTFPYPVIGHTNVLVAPPGTTTVRFQHYQTQMTGNENGGTYMDDVTLNQTGGPVPPQITQVYPGNMLFASNHISFHVASASSSYIDRTNIHLVVNGADVSSSPSMLITSNSPSDTSVTYTGLTAGVWAYTASIAVTDAYAFTASATMSFDTITPAFVWEAEDYDFTNGLYINSPILSSTPQPNSYFGTMGVTDVDYSRPAGPSGQNETYRTNDWPGIGPAGEVARQKFLTAQLTDPGVVDYNVGYINTGDWFNYTRDIPAGTYNIYARLAGGAGATAVTLEKVSGGTTNTVGVFHFTGIDWGVYDYVPLVDNYGNLLPVTLGGVATFRATLSSGGDNMNFFMLVPAQVGLPVLSNISPTNGTVFATGDTFSFTADSASGINADGIHLLLNGADVTSSLGISGSANTKNVSCALLSSNSLYTAVIAVTNAAGVGLTRTVQFDTMRTDNFIVQCEDYDYNGGLWDTVNNGLLPGGYAGFDAYTNIDFNHDGGGGTFPYRSGGLPEEQASDVLLPGYSVDYDVGNFNDGNWGNYTRNYPAGKYLVYGRLAGYSLTAYLDRVTSGWGTTNQTTQRLGTWSANPNGWQNWAWVALTDADLAAPVILTLGGTNTLRVTSGGNVNANYFMLVPAQGFSLTAAKSGSNIVLSFPTQAGASYRVFSRASLNTGAWSLVATVPGNGSVRSVSDPIGTGTRFYEVTSP